MLRKRALTRSTSYISYLVKQLQTVTIAEYRDALIENLAQQEKARMTALGQASYVSERLGAPAVSEAPTSPPAAYILFLALLLGLIAGILFARMADARGWHMFASQKLYSPRTTPPTRSGSAI